MIKVLFRLCSLALKQPRNSSIRIGPSMPRVDPDCSVEVRNSFRVASFFQEGVAPISVSGDEMRIDLNAATVIKNSPIQVASRLSCDAAIAVRFGEPWVKGYCSIIVC